MENMLRTKKSVGGTVADTVIIAFLGIMAFITLFPFYNFGFVIVTMYFGGGLIPWYLVVKAVGLVDNIFVMILPATLNTFYMILMKNYFLTIPESLEESAKIDGANDIYILFRIIIPTGAPIIATISLFYAVDRWNEWWSALLRLRKLHRLPKIYHSRTLLKFP